MLEEGFAQESDSRSYYLSDNCLSLRVKMYPPHPIAKAVCPVNHRLQRWAWQRQGRVPLSRRLPDDATPTLTALRVVRRRRRRHPTAVYQCEVVFTVLAYSPLTMFPPPPNFSASGPILLIHLQRTEIGASNLLLLHRTASSGHLGKSDDDLLSSVRKGLIRSLSSRLAWACNDFQFICKVVRVQMMLSMLVRQRSECVFVLG